MSQPNGFNNVLPEAKRPSIWLPTLGVAIVLVGGFAIYQNNQLQDVRHDLTTSQKDVTALRTSIAGASDEARKQIDTLRGQLVTAQQQNSEVLSQAQAVAKHRADAAVARLDKKHAEQVAALDAALNEVKESNAQTSSRLAGVTSDVNHVQTDVADTKTRLDKSITDLQSVRGDLGMMSGLVATNSKEIEVLRKLGDRNIYEFNLTKKSGMERVGDIQMRLVKTNPRRNQYSVVVSADDKTIEKKDKTTNEPVQFYVASKARQPYEVVVNEVGKNAIKGYLATPKVTTARNN